MDQVNVPERRSYRYSVSGDGSAENPRIVEYAWLKAISDSAVRYGRGGAAEEAAIASVSVACYRDCSLEELIAAFRDDNAFPDLVPIHHVLSKYDSDRSLLKTIFAKFSARNPRFSSRYADGRLLSKTAPFPFEIVPKADGSVLHVYHDDADGSWIRDAYELDATGNARFHSYVTAADDAQYEADVDLAMAQGQGRMPKMRDYSGFVPPAVHDPVAKIGAVRASVGRILDIARL